MRVDYQDSQLGEMRAAAAALVVHFDDGGHELGALPFAHAARRQFTYLPRPRPGVCLADLDRAARKAAYRLLATALSPTAYAQAVAVMALEEVLDRREGWRRGRHSNDYWVAVFGDPARDKLWAWRWEGHHLSVTMTVVDEEVFATPLFFGAHPACVGVAGRPVLRPLGPEEDLARALLDGMGPAGRARAIIADVAPPDIRSSTHAQVAEHFVPPGVNAAQLDGTSRALLDQLVTLYFGRLPDELASREADRVRGGQLHFAWEGPVQPGPGHYYRIQGPDLLIEYDNTAHGANHAHCVLRRPAHDFGGDALAAHHAQAHADDAGVG
jgi:hypothetical protein